MNYYIFSVNNISHLFNGLKGSKFFFHSYNIFNYGIPTENIFFRNFKNYSCNLISKDIKNDNKIIPIIIKPENIKIINDYEFFIIYNFFDFEYLKLIMKDKITQIFDENKYNENKLYFNKIKNIYDKQNIDIFRIQENFDLFCYKFKNLPFIISENEIPKIIKILNSNDNFYYLFDNFKDYTKETYEPIPYTTLSINFGFGDFLQRLNKLYTVLEYSGYYKLVKIKNISYSNHIHQDNGIFNLFDFPGFSHIEYDNPIDKSIIKINFYSLFDIILYDKYFFHRYFKSIILYINPSLNFINPNRNICNFKNSDIIPFKTFNYYTDINWNFKKFSENKLIILHFRRGDYINMILNNHKNSRSIMLFNEYLEIISSYFTNEIILDCIIISDDFNYNIIKNKSYIPLLRDYDIPINKNIKFKNIQLIIKDKILGSSKEKDFLTLKYLANANYFTGNMSCFPHILSQIFNKNLKFIRPLKTTKYILNTKDLDALLK